MTEYAHRTDVELIDAASGGDGRAFQELFRRHNGRIYRQAVRSTSVREDAEDVVAITFMETWRRRRSIRYVDESALPWLLVTAANVNRNLVRASRRNQKFLGTLPHEFPGDEPTATDPSLTSALRSLSRTDQHLIALTLDGFSTAEAANYVGITPAAARTRLTRARQRLRRTIEDGRQLSDMVPEGIG